MVNTGRLAKLRQGLRDRDFWRNMVRNILINNVPKIVYRKNTGYYVLSEDWDYLIILDACRYDVFEQEFKRYNLEGKLEYRISRGSSTPEFLVENFGDGKFDDIVYITANPYVDMLLKRKFYRIISVWKDGWDYKLNTVHPKTVYQYTLRALERYPDKRFIIHFMQPHFPYLTFRPLGDTGFSKHREAVLEGQTKWRDRTIWDLVLENRVPLNKVKEAYRDNLRIALRYVELLVFHLGGKIIITSDHGEAFGEKLHPLIPLRIYGHPKNVRIPPLVKVPWVVINKPSKRKIKKGLEEKTKVKEIIYELKLKGRI